MNAKPLTIRPFEAMHIMDRARQLSTQGKPIVHCEIGAPSVPPFRTQPQGQQADANYYTSALGLHEARQNIANLTAVAVENVVIGHGTSTLLWSLACLLRNYTIVTPSPYYPAYNAIPTMVGSQVETVFTGYSAYDIDALVKHGGRSKVLLIGSPSNPLGLTISRSDIRVLCQSYAYVILDQLYSSVVSELEPCNARDADNLMILDGLSKKLALPGLRIGWLLAPTKIVAALEPVLQHGTLCPSLPSQKVAASINWDDAATYIAANREIYRSNASILVDTLCNLGHAVITDGSQNFYIVTEQQRTCLETLERYHVATAPGSDFGPDLQHTTRWSTCHPLLTIQQAVTNLCA